MNLIKAQASVGSKSSVSCMVQTEHSCCSQESLQR
jgi:hypothetical protein